jgi:uncharacterized protein with WD repeat
MDVMETIEKEQEFYHFPGAEIAKFSPIDGKYLAVVDFVGIHIIEVETKQELLKIEKKGIIALEWSPLSSFVISCIKHKEGQNNLELWDSKTGSLVYSCEWKNFAKDGPKSIKFDSQEKFCARQIGKSIIEVYENGNFKEPKL